MRRRKLVSGVRNAFEDRIRETLSKNKVKFAYESEKLPYTIEGNYINDFPCLSALDGHKIYIETKGHFRREDKRKLAAVKKCHPDIDLRIIFYRMIKSNIRWCNKHKIPYAFHTVPDEWLAELVG